MCNTCANVFNIHRWSRAQLINKMTSRPCTVSPSLVIVNRVDTKGDTNTLSHTQCNWASTHTNAIVSVIVLCKSISRLQHKRLFTFFCLLSFSLSLFLVQIAHTTTLFLPASFPGKNKLNCERTEDNLKENKEKDTNTHTAR